MPSVITAELGETGTASDCVAGLGQALDIVNNYKSENIFTNQNISILAVLIFFCVKNVCLIAGCDW